MSRFFAKLFVALMLTICVTISLQAQWTSFKLPGGVHHKTVFIDHADVQAMASVCMSNYLCVKEWNGSGWEDWEEVEASFYSTWGVDWAVIDDDAYIVVGGQEMRVIYYDGDSWEIESEMQDNAFKYPSFYRVEACVFYADSNGLEYDNVLVHLTETADVLNYGLRYWNSDQGSWDYVDSPTETRGYGARMWRALEDPEVVYMTGHETYSYDPTKIYWINVAEAITDFDPEEIITSGNTSSATHGVDNVVDVPTFYQCEHDGVYYQYVMAHTQLTSNDYYDIWYREYDSGWSNWSILIKDFDDSDQLPGLVDGSGNLGAVQIAARPYADGETIEHRVYIASSFYGLTGYDSELFVPSVVNPALNSRNRLDGQ